MPLFKKKKTEEKKDLQASSIEKENGDGTGISIKVLGTGCGSCHALVENVKKAVEQKGLDVEVEFITDMKIAMQYCAMAMPALVVNGKLVSAGRIYKPSQIIELLDKFCLLDQH